MQSSVWEFKNNKIACSDTFFTSQFFDFNNECSQMEDFDISKQYLRSQLSQKSTILRHISEQYFLKALEVYYKLCLHDSLLLWKKVNQKEKRKEMLNPKNMTKVFLRVFYLLNKKIRSKIEKSFVKMVNFTKSNDMKTYETPMVKGVKKLNESLETLNSKYFYCHPIVSQQLVQYSFKEIQTFGKAIKNKTELQILMSLLQKMSNHVALQQFYEKLSGYQKLEDKLQILFGTLSLLINPIKRNFMQKFKENNLTLNYILNELDESVRTQHRQTSNQYDILPSKQQTQSVETRFKKSFEVSNEVECYPLTQELGSKKTSQKSDNDYLVQSTEYQPLQKDYIPETKNSLTFSKQLRRKSPSLQKKNKFKFKSIPAGTPKKQPPKETYIQKNLQLKPDKDNQSSSLIKQKSDVKCQQINQNECKINFSSIAMNSKALKVNMAFQNSLNYATKSNRKITTKQKIALTHPHKPHQLSSSYADYFDFYAFSDIPNDKRIKQAQSALLLKQQSKKGFKIFRTIKSGKSFTNLDEVPNSTPKDQSFKNNQSKFLFKLPQAQIADSLLSQKITSQRIPIQRRKMESLTVLQRQNPTPVSNFQEFATQRLMNFRSLQKAASNSSLYDLKHQYKFPITSKSNKNIEILPKHDSTKTSNDFYSEYQSNPYQYLNQNTKQNKEQKSSQPIRNSSLTFKTNRPMKKVKSGEKQIGIKGIQGKKQRKSDKNGGSKSKRHKQIKSQFIESKQQVLNSYYKLQTNSMLTVRCGKSVSQKSLNKNLGLKTMSKK